MADQESILDLVLTRDEVTDVLRRLDQEGYWPEANYTVRDVVEATHEDLQKVYQALLAVRDPSIGTVKHRPPVQQSEMAINPDSLTPEEIRLVRLWLSRMEFQWKMGWIMLLLVVVPMILIVAAMASHK